MAVKEERNVEVWTEKGDQRLVEAKELQEEKTG